MLTHLDETSLADLFRVDNSIKELLSIELLLFQLTKVALSTEFCVDSHTKYSIERKFIPWLLISENKNFEKMNEAIFSCTRFFLI